MRGDLTQAKPRPASRDTRIAEPRPASTSRPQIIVTLHFLYRRSCTEYVCGRQGLKVGMLPVSFSRTLTRYTPAAHCGRHAGQWPTREECASPAHSKPLSRTTCHGAASAAAIPAIDSPPARHLAVQQALLQLSWRRPPCSTKIVVKSSLPRVLMVRPPFPVDNSPLCTIQVQQIVTSSGLNRWRSAGPIREVRRMDRMSFWLASSRWRGWQWPAEHPQQPRVCHIGHGSIPSEENDQY